MKKTVFIFTIIAVAIGGVTLILYQTGKLPVDLSEISFFERKLEPPVTPISFFKGVIFAASNPGGLGLSKIQQAKEDNANIVVVALDMKTEGNQWVLSHASFQKSNAKKLIKEAYKQGLQVELRTLANPESNTPTQPEEFLKNTLPAIKELALFAKDHKVYQFTLLGEVDNRWGLGEHEGFVETYATEIFKEARKYYAGRIGIGFCCHYDKSYNIAGYDYLLVSIYPGPLPKTMIPHYLREFERNVGIANKLAERNDIKEVMIGEFGFTTPKEVQQFPFMKQFTMELTEDEEASLYHDIFARTSENVSGYSIFYSFPVMSVVERKSENTMKEWFGRL